MGSLSVWHWLLFLAVALLMFGGKGKISSIMGDVAEGIKSFKKGMAEDKDAANAGDPAKKEEAPKVIESAKPLSQPAGVEANKAGWSAKG
jgi:sec-independent protein translocase protein TatA